MTTSGLITQPEPWHKGVPAGQLGDGITECLRLAVVLRINQEARTRTYT
jgi:hypothetical protein